MPSRPRQSDGDELTSRTLDPRRLREELLAVEAFHREMGIPGIHPGWFESVGRAEWHLRNPSVYRVYEQGGKILGFFALVPLQERCADDLLSRRRSLWWDVSAADILDPTEHERARFFGCTLLMDAYLVRQGSDSGAEDAVQRRIRWDLTAELRRTHLTRILGSTSNPLNEATAETVGLRVALDGEKCPTGIRRLWSATPQEFADREPLTTAGLPYLWYIFDDVRRRFTPPPNGLCLNEQHQKVAYLFYLEGCKEKQIPERVHLGENTVHDYLGDIRDRAEKILPAFDGQADRRTRGRSKPAVAAHLRDYPGEIQAAGSLFDKSEL